MNPILQNVSNFAVWGSLAATVILGIFFLVQTIVDPLRRLRFGFFALTMGYLGGLDLSRSVLEMNPLTYEWTRLWWAAAYVGCCYWLLNYPWQLAFGSTVFIAVLGFSAYRLHPALATTITFPWAFGLTTVAFGRRYLKDHGYASALLAAYSAAMALSCGLYFAIVARGILAAILLGYLHFAISSIASVLLGWIHLTRELEGRAPVKTNPRLAVGLFAAVFLSEAAVMGSLLTYQGGLPALYFLASLVQFGSALAVYLHHRHQLVIHAANVGQLLDERTAELRVAQEELARQNEILAQRLSEQARDLKAKTEVIDRQRRLELAAQTAGQVAHDIQNLLSPILTRAEDLDQARSLGEIREISTVIRRQVQALLDLNTQLLALSRRGRVEQQPVYLSELVRDVVERFPGQQITIDLQGEAWASGSWSQLSRAISNLVTNALESNLDRLVPVTVRVRTAEVAQNRRCHLGFLGPGRYAVIEIEDRGPGIPEGHLDKIFEPFFSSKTGKHRSGSGLGLTIVAAVVDDHKGVLDLETGAQGTRFTLYFPATQPPADAPELVKLSCNATVLVVDDDSSIQREYGKLLQEAGYTVIPAESGAQAIRVLQAQEVDLVLLDLQMPRMNGLETFLGAMHVRPGVRAVVHSSYITEQQGAQLKALGVCSLLLKPAGRLDLLRALRHAYDEKKASEGRRKGHLP